MRDKLIFTGTILWGLSMAIILTILLAIPLFYLDIGWEHLTDLVNMSAETIKHNFNILMAYLLNPFAGSLNMPDFPSSDHGLQHFKEVKQLFMLALTLAIVLIPALVLFIKNHLSILFHNGLRVVMGTPIFLGIVASLIGFDNFFISFHQLLFRDNTWMFDPTTDPIINVLTENYFMFSFLMFAIIYELIFFGLYWIGNKHRQFKRTVKTEQ